MLHPALARALASAHIDDLHRAAGRWHTIRLAHRAAHEPRVAATPIAILRSAATRLRGRRAPQAEGIIRTEVPQAALWPCQSVVDVRSGPRARIDRASNKERPASSLTRTSRGSESLVFECFTLENVDVGEVTLRVRHGGDGQPVVVLPGRGRIQRGAG